MEKNENDGNLKREKRILVLRLLFVCSFLDLIFQFLVFMVKKEISFFEASAVVTKVFVSVFPILIGNIVTMDTLKNIRKNDVFIKRNYFYLILCLFLYIAINFVSAFRFNSSNTNWYDYLFDVLTLIVSIVFAIIMSVVVIKNYFAYLNEKGDEIINTNTGYKGDPNALGKDKANITANMLKDFDEIDVDEGD